ncbi:Xaa-Pro peptidase family protein [Acidisoma sp. S159]|uniref:M24 family metallopeptidase n=1 Tax=Acidisoma sp. S159 TaxID=1747225 RepID=UPI00131AC918|nr:Xaa-Pro peptidase family protein [Acidisoma sp. S159]
MSKSTIPIGVPFDTKRLDSLMEEDNLDAVLITSKHNIQYMLGGYRFFFYSFADAHGLSRYLPILIYVKGRPEDASYVGSPMEKYEEELGKFWMPELHFGNMTVEQYAATAVTHLKRLGQSVRRLGVEMDFLPHTAFATLKDGLPESQIVNANLTLEMLRAVKTPIELAILRDASEKVVDAMIATFAQHRVGSTKGEIIATLKKEETARGLHFEYGLVNIGRSFNRAPSAQIWQKGEVLALDSGGNDRGYIGDLCRMGFPGVPDEELVDLLAHVDEVQQAARRPIRPGVKGGDIYAGPEAILARSPYRDQLDFVAHGMGIVGHEAPWLSDRSPVPYPAHHANKPLVAGMVISIETTLSHPRRGFIKLEDTVAVTNEGWEAFGDYGREWNRALP